MAQIALYNQQGTKQGELEINDAIFGVRVKQEVVHQVYVALEANKREPWAHTKDRGDVRGGGRKPWRQKGTGRARHGSIRSPLWRGGGVTFGPLNTRNYKQKVNKKTRQLATKMCLTDKVGDEKMIVLEALKATGKTKDTLALWKKLPGFNRSTLFLIADSTDEKLLLSMRNIQKLHAQRVEDVNVTDLLNHQYVLTTKEGIKKLEKRFS